MKKSASILILCLALSACAGSGDGRYAPYLARKGVTRLAPDGFDHCHGYGCRLIGKAALTDGDWQDIEPLFVANRSAEEERVAIASAIGIFEQKIGERTGTSADKGGTYVQLGDNQHDCVDESVNTTIYLSLLDGHGLLRHHTAGTPTARIPPFSRGLGPHQTAIITDTGSSDRFAVDSWFHDNGVPAEIVPLDAWFFGWRPGK